MCGIVSSLVTEYKCRSTFPTSQATVVMLGRACFPGRMDPFPSLTGQIFDKDILPRLARNVHRNVHLKSTQRGFRVKTISGKPHSSHLPASYRDVVFTYAHAETSLISCIATTELPSHIVIHRVKHYTHHVEMVMVFFTQRVFYSSLVH